MRRFNKSSDMSVQQLLPILELQQAAHARKVEPTYGAKAETVTPRRGLDRVRHGARLEQAEAPGKVAVNGFYGSGLVYEKEGEARLFEGRPVGERLVDISIQFRPQGDRHETVFDWVIVERSRGKTGNAVGLGVQIGLHRIQAAGGAVGVLAGVSFCHPAEFGQKRTERDERDRFRAKVSHGLPAADAVLQRSGPGGVVQPQPTPVLGEGPDAVVPTSECVLRRRVQDQVEIALRRCRGCRADLGRDCVALLVAVGKGGGGRPDLAQAGGPDAGKANEALAAVGALLR